MKPSPAVVWFRNDLRLADNPALHAARQRGGAVVPVFIWAPEEEAPWVLGAASRWWLHQSLVSLDSSLRAAGSRLIIQRGPTIETLRTIVVATGAGAVFWNRRYEPAILQRDAKIEVALRSDGLVVESFSGALLHEPGSIRNQSGKPFQVFTPFWKQCLREPEPTEPMAAPRRWAAPEHWPECLHPDALGLAPRIPWAGGLRAAWSPGEAGALAQLQRFLLNGASDYGENRNRPDRTGTSRLSPHLHFGEIGPRQIWHALRRQAAAGTASATATRNTAQPGAGGGGQGTRAGLAVLPDWRGSPFLTEVGWREFAHHLLYHFPKTTGQPLRASFERFPWREDAALLAAWQKGRTGYPIVDAGMRELWTTGWMHNRVRMIVASFLVKDLMISWTEGARWFWDTLVDADLAQNTLGWQWTAGCGADAAPYFRIFNPVSQGEKFDPQGDYVRAWCPELARLSDEWVHQPWKAPAAVLTRAEISLGQTYPRPIVSHAIAREVALEAFARLRAL